MARLAVFVHVADKNGEVHAFGPDDDVPAWAAKAITNPDAWEDAPEAPKTPAKKAAKATAPRVAPAAAPVVDVEPSQSDAPAPKPAPGEAFAAESGDDPED